MASKYAEQIKKLLREIYPEPQPIITEVSVSSLAKDIIFSEGLKDLITKYEARLGRMRVDFWVKSQIAVEVQGEQHEREIRFSNEIKDTEAELQRRIGLDRVKQGVLNESGIPLVCIWYYEIDKLTPDILRKKIEAAQTCTDSVRGPRESSKSTMGSSKKILSVDHANKPPKRNKLNRYNRRLRKSTLVNSLGRRTGDSKLKRLYRYYKEKDKGEKV